MREPLQLRSLRSATLRHGARHAGRTVNNSQLIDIPEPQREVARAAITAALGSNPIDAIMPVLGGVSGALVYRVDAGGRRYVLRMEGAAAPFRNPHQYSAMRVAAEAKIAPRIHYIDEDARIVLMDFVEDRPLEIYPRGRLGLARAVGEILMKVQALPSFQRGIAYPGIVVRLWDKVRQSGLFANGLLDAHSEKLARIAEAYAWDSGQSVAGHNDVLPRNLLFDGDRLWLIDWEGACLNDPLIDVGTALDNFAPTPELEQVLLHAWRQRPLDSNDRDRLLLIRALNRLAYASILFRAASHAPRIGADRDLSELTSDEFERAVRAGRLKPETPATSHALGKMFLASFLTDGPAPGLPPLFMR